VPELPEVETTLRGIEPHILNLPIADILIRESKLRWKVPERDLKKNLLGPQKHDHIDITFNNNSLLRFTDPRKFGSFLWVEDPELHPLLKNLGPEPLGNSFSGDYLFRASRKRKVPLKNFIMNSRVLVGVGNIYASEALFLSGIRPQKRAGTINRKQYDLLASSIKDLLQSSIDKGGTTLRDFVGGDSKPGYFKNELLVYGRSGLCCKSCSTLLKEIRRI